MQARTGISERRACQLIGLSRSVLRYQPRASVQNTELRRAKFGGMTVADAKRLKDLELENSRLKKLLAEAHLDIESLKVVARGKG